MNDPGRDRSLVERLYARGNALAVRGERPGVMLLAALSVAYWGLTGLLATRKLMWNDELYTFYIARLPTMADVRGALMAGGEQLPPLFYVPTRVAFGLFGVSHLSIRLPEMFGFWVMIVALFAFVARRTSPFSALCAAIFPLVTMAYYYAFEARPYGLVLGFSAVALLCWQNAASIRYRVAALALLAVSLCGAVSSHYYGVFVILPLALGELVRAVSRRQLDLPVWIAFALPAIPLIAHLPLIRAARSYSGAFWAPPQWVNIPDFYSHLLIPAVVPLTVLLVVSILHVTLLSPPPSDGADSTRAASHPPLDEVVAALGFVVIPAVCVVAAKVATGAFTPRYAMPAVIGFAVLAGFGIAGAFRTSPLMRLAALACLCGWFVLSQGRELIAPTSFSHRFPPRLIAQPAEWVRTFSERDLPVVVADAHTFTMLSHYGEPQIKARLVYLADPELALKHLGHNSVERGMLDLLKPWFLMNVVEYRQFVAEHSRFLVYGDFVQMSFLNWLLPQLQADGMRFELLNRRGNHMLVLAMREMGPTTTASRRAGAPPERSTQQ